MRLFCYALNIFSCLNFLLCTHFICFMHNIITLTNPIMIKLVVLPFIVWYWICFLLTRWSIKGTTWIVTFPLWHWLWPALQRRKKCSVDNWKNYCVNKSWTSGNFHFADKTISYVQQYVSNSQHSLDLFIHTHMHIDVYTYK